MLVQLDVTRLARPNSLIRLNPRRIVTENAGSAIFERLAEPWNPAGYSSPSYPLTVGHVVDSDTFSTGFGPTLLRLVPIKLPKSDVRVPMLASQGEEAIQKIIDHSYSTNPSYENSYAYLTFFSGIVPPGRNQRVSFTLHGDQMQSLDPKFQYTPDWTYLVSDKIPTVFYDQSFDLSETLRAARKGGKVNLYDTFSQQRNESSTYPSKNYEIYLIDPYVVHRASISEHVECRTFLKVVFSSHKFYDTREHYRNPAFDYENWFTAQVQPEGYLPFGDPNTKYLV